MGLRDWLPRKRDRTAEWLRDPRLALALDFGSGALCGVALGEPFERVAFLGPTGRPPHPGGDLEYLALGLAVGVSDEKIDSYIVCWQDDLDAGYAPYAGSVLHEGRRVSLGPATTEAQVVAAFGPPYWRDRDDTETILFYELHDRWGRLTERQVELDAKGALKGLIVRAVPMLAGEDDRRGYGVDKPWPPA